MKTFKQISNLDPNTLMLVDGLNMAFSFRGKTDFRDKYINMILSLQRSYKAGKVIVACDKGSSSYRKNIFPEYKQNRKERFSAQTEQERLEFEAFFKEFNAAIDILKNSGDYPFPIIQFEGVEADDIAAYVTKKLKKNNNIWLISSDKDWDLLVDNNVSRFSYVTRKEVTIDNWNTHYEFDPSDYISIKCLTGDLGDGIPGVDGIGPKRAISLVQEFGSAYDIAVNLPISSKYKYVASLNSFGTDNIIRNYMLMDIVTHCEDALGDDNIREIDRILGGYIEGI